MREAYRAREMSNFDSYYFESDVPCLRNRPNRHDDGGIIDHLAPPFSIFNYPGKGGPKYTPKRKLTEMELKSATTHVLLNCPEVQPYHSYFVSTYGNDVVYSRFSDWFKEHVEDALDVAYQNDISSVEAMVDDELAGNEEDITEASKSIQIRGNNTILNQLATYKSLQARPDIGPLKENSLPPPVPPQSTSLCHLSLLLNNIHDHAITRLPSYLGSRMVANLLHHSSMMLGVDGKNFPTISREQIWNQFKTKLKGAEVSNSEVFEETHKKRNKDDTSYLNLDSTSSSDITSIWTNVAGGVKKKFMEKHMAESDESEGTDYDEE
ncbi:hypothetical protein H5410_037560 [Solanum commersonii]|uniref:Uncharacterized protein n=1 Tax=Solanum commersonii TaxID=4109 RepID=A0A9J5Y9V6_SOLCO|nr:hypothetical protein H5410_037560 [Solanum commersonii]